MQAIAASGGPDRKAFLNKVSPAAFAAVGLNPYG
jgi:hypothetical protein